METPVGRRRTLGEVLFPPPVRGWALAEWALVPLRLFLAAIFLYAGCQKLANPNFFDPNSPISIHQQLIAASRTSPISGLLSHLVSHSTPVGLVIAIGEIFVGLGALVGLWTRVAALGGMIISLMLFLTVSFHSSPFYTGADIVYFFAWTPLLVAGAGSRLSLDGWIADRTARRLNYPSPVLVPIPFSTVQGLCGHYAGGQCRALEGPCDAAACPVLLGGRVPLTRRRSLDVLDRRTVVTGGVAAGVVAIGGLLVAGAAHDGGYMVNDAPRARSDETALPEPSTTSTTPTTSSTTPGSSTAPTPSGTLLGDASSVGLNKAASFTIPQSGDPGIIIHLPSGAFVGYDAVCPHMGCTVGWSGASELIVCPCHNSQFNPETGDVIVGPAPHGLEKLKIVEGANHKLYLE